MDGAAGQRDWIQSKRSNGREGHWRDSAMAIERAQDEQRCSIKE